MKQEAFCYNRTENLFTTEKNAWPHTPLRSADPKVTGIQVIAVGRQRDHRPPRCMWTKMKMLDLD